MTLQLLQGTLGNESDGPLHKPLHVDVYPGALLYGLESASIYGLRALTMGAQICSGSPDVKDTKTPGPELGLVKLVRHA